MRDALESILHVAVEEKEFRELKKLPLMLKGAYEIKLFNIAGEDMVFIAPKENITFPILKKQWKKFQELLNLPCVVYGNNISTYGKKRMIELQIPFVFGTDNMYLPMMGIRLQKSDEPALPEVEKFSPFTQKLILTAIYKGWKKKTSKELSEEMAVSRMTVNRALVELKALGLPLTSLEANNRIFQNDYSVKGLFEMTKDYMINPVSKSYSLSETPKQVKDKGGMSALSEYSMIGDNNYVTYAVSRDEARNMNLDSYKKLPKSEMPVCVVEVLRYKIAVGEGIDPISAFLSLTYEEKNDPRVKIEIEEILEEIWNGKWNREI